MSQPGLSAELHDLSQDLHSILLSSSLTYNVVYTTMMLSSYVYCFQSIYLFSTYQIQKNHSSGACVFFFPRVEHHTYITYRRICYCVNQKSLQYQKSFCSLWLLLCLLLNGQQLHLVCKRCQSQLICQTLSLQQGVFYRIVCLCNKHTFLSC